jgi:hypothetical protein
VRGVAAAVLPFLFAASGLEARDRGTIAGQGASARSVAQIECLPDP